MTLVSILPGPPVQEGLGQVASGQSASQLASWLAAIYCAALSTVQPASYTGWLGQTPHSAYILRCGDITMSVGKIKIHIERF